MLPYFRRSEDNPERPGDPFHGQGGPLRVTRARGENPLYAEFLAAGRADGARRNEDFNGADQEGLGLYDFNVKDGRRVSSATAFLRPAMPRPEPRGTHRHRRASDRDRGGACDRPRPAPRRGPRRR